jgi:MFS family permease
MILARFLHCIPRHFVVTILYCIAFFLLGLNIASTGPLLIDLTKQVNVSIAEGGVFFSSRAAGYFLGSLGSSIIDRFPHKAIDSLPRASSWPVARRRWCR